MTREVKFTPGPWRTDENGSIVCYPDGLSVGVLSRQLPEEEVNANHLLIVSAPDLLMAAKRFFTLEVETCRCEICVKWVDELKAAISKATA